MSALEHVLENSFEHRVDEHSVSMALHGMFCEGEESGEWWGCMASAAFLGNWVVGLLLFESIPERTGNV